MVRSAPSRSALLTAKMSAISRIPALIACTSSPRPGASTTTVVWAVLATSTSALSHPDRFNDNPIKAGSIQQHDNIGGGLRQSTQAAARGHRADEDAGSPARSRIRTRSPSSAPPLNGLVGSTAMMPTVSPLFRYSPARPLTKVDLPVPGDPVMPRMWAEPARG